jgi:hypothetical protein
VTAHVVAWMNEMRPPVAFEGERSKYRQPPRKAFSLRLSVPNSFWIMSVSVFAASLVVIPSVDKL